MRVSVRAWPAGPVPITPTRISVSSTHDNLGTSYGRLPNSFRLPAQYGVDLLVRRRVRLGRFDFGVYVDVRNLTKRRNVESVRRDTGAPGPGEVQITGMAEQAYTEHPEPIPYESPRYRGWADADGDGVIQGAELPPLFLAAARDYYQPLFAYGPPRLLRLGLEVIF